MTTTTNFILKKQKKEMIFYEKHKNNTIKSKIKQR